MEEIQKFLETPVIKNSNGSALINAGHVVMLAAGAVVLYMFIPERKRRNLFK